MMKYSHYSTKKMYFEADRFNETLHCMSNKLQKNYVEIKKFAQKSFIIYAVCISDEVFLVKTIWKTLYQIK